MSAGARGSPGARKPDAARIFRRLLPFPLQRQSQPARDLRLDGCGQELK
jgi:hypothetical protein